MHLRRRRSHGFLALNITPLIDVVFQLLVFFMLSTNFARFRLIGVEAPQERQVVASAQGAIVIQIGADGALLFDGAPAARDSLTARVSAVIAVDPNRTFLIRPGVGVDLQTTIAAYDETRAAGARAVSFSRLRMEGAGP